MQKPQIVDSDNEKENVKVGHVDSFQSDNKEKENKEDNNADIDYSQWKIIYPNYLNKQKKIREGRRISEKHCVNNPSIYNIELACRELKVTYFVEKTKCYPRDWEIEGRIRIKLPDEKLQIFNKIDLIRRIGLKMQQMNVDNLPPSYSLGPDVIHDENKAMSKKKKKKSKGKDKDRDKHKERDKEKNREIGNGIG